MGMVALDSLKSIPGILNRRCGSLISIKLKPNQPSFRCLEKNWYFPVFSR